MRFLFYALILSTLIQITVNAQTENYVVKKLPFSSSEFDEFAPVYFQNGIVFCSNKKNRQLLTYSTADNKGPIKIYFADSAGINKEHYSQLFSRELTTVLNDGPVTFSAKGNLIYFSRNLNADGRLGDISDLRNKLGLFEAEFIEGKWSKIKEFRFNNEVYNITTPCLSPDEYWLYFASDMPGGYGGFDIYCSQWKNDYWDKPVNLGPMINTSKNELYPFIRVNGEMFFTSDGHGGLGGKDIFYSKMENGEWLSPVPLDSPVNSRYDDFAFISNPSSLKGYFSSNRDHSVDIYQFDCVYPQIFYCSKQETNQYCFQFIDDNEIKIDNVQLQFEWDFGDGTKTNGFRVEHCYPGSGKYILKQNIVEKKTGRILFNKLSASIEIRKILQPYISCPDMFLVGTPVSFDASDSYLPGYEVIRYTWDVGDGSKNSGKSITHVFRESGKELIKLAVSAKEIHNEKIREFCVAKEVYIASTPGELASFREEAARRKTVFANLSEYKYASHDTSYDASKEIARNAVFQAAVLFSPEKINLNQGILKTLANKYTLKQEYVAEQGLFACIIEEGRSFLDVYNACSDAIAYGFKEAKVITYIQTDPAEKELAALKRVYGLSSDNFFLPDDSRLSQNAYPLLDQLVDFMKKYPDLTLVISSFTDNTGSSNLNVQLTKNRSQNMVNYLVGRGIEKSRLVSKGLGSARPLTSNDSEEDRKQNRRVDFTILNK